MKRNLRLILIVAVVAALSIVAYKMATQGDGKSKMSDEALSDFAVKDTASIDKLILSDTEGYGVTLNRNGEIWEIDGQDCIQQHIVHMMLKTIKHVTVKSPVPKSSVETINKNLTTRHKKVEIYVKGELSKTWYVGEPTQDQYGTYMLLKDPEKGKSPEPFIMYMPNMYGNLRSRFVTNPLEYECTGVFNYDPLNIKTIEVELPDSNQYGYTITALGEGRFDLSSNGQKMMNFDTVRVRSYVVGFRKIHFEQHNYLINEKSEDSLKATNPWFDFTVTDVNGEQNHVLCYKKRMIYTKYDYDGNLIEIDRDRLWVVLNDGRLVVGQYYAFDKILRDIRFFLKGDTPL